MTQLKALIASGILLPIAGGATVEEYDAAIAAISEGKQELRRKLDALVTDWLIASKSPDSHARQQAVSAISQQLNQLVAENPDDHAPIRAVQRYIVAEYREETTVGQPFQTDRVRKDRSARAEQQPTGEQVRRSVPPDPAASQSARDWERQVQELHRQQYRIRQPQRHAPRAAPETLIKRAVGPTQWESEPEEPGAASPGGLWLRVGVNLAGLLIVGGTVLGVNYLLGNPLKDGMIWLMGHLSLVLDYLQTILFARL